MITILGLDMAVDPRRRGVARGRLDGDACLVDRVWRGDHADTSALVAEGLAQGPVLLAVDAPLGWPRPLAEALGDHRAGSPPGPTADAMFRRHTDRVLARRLGKTPMDVGADRIARTAHAALTELARISAALGAPVELLWTWDRLPPLSAVEVYPGGLLVAAGFPVVSGYKPASATAARRAIVTGLAGHLTLSAAARAGVLADADQLDAALCVLAGWDMVRGLAPAPGGRVEQDLARREGWIWCRERPE
ncbi:MAG: DUF429 domain-containing protein [Candidatus Krumholzibacteriia bacterium]